MWFLLTNIESIMDIMRQNEVLAKRGTVKKLLATSIKKTKKKHLKLFGRTLRKEGFENLTL